jgi:hypothetical protein
MKVSGLVVLSAAALAALAMSTSRSPAHVASPFSGVCGADYYLNVSGACVHRPMRSDTVPTGATAQCEDGTYSFSQHRRGTCNYHGGVAQWL